MFDIYLTGEFVPESGNCAMYGKIQIDDFTETFIASLICWSPAQYERHWREACQRLIDGMYSSALITSYVDAARSEFLVWWPIYRHDDVLHARNEFLVYADLTKPFAIENPWQAIRDRKTFNDEGLPISEWEMQIQSISDFLARKRTVGRRRNEKG